MYIFLLHIVKKKKNNNKCTVVIWFNTLRFHCIGRRYKNNHFLQYRFFGPSLSPVKLLKYPMFRVQTPDIFLISYFTGTVIVLVEFSELFTIS